MVARASEEVRQKWKADILQQRGSGLSVARWCRQHNINVYRFRYWQARFFPKPFLERSAFKELSDSQSHIVVPQSGITLEYQGVYLHIDKRFDLLSLKQCLKVLKEMPC